MCDAWSLWLYSVHSACVCVCVCVCAYVCVHVCVCECVSGLELPAFVSFTSISSPHFHLIRTFG